MYREAVDGAEPGMGGAGSVDICQVGCPCWMQRANTARPALSIYHHTSWSIFVGHAGSPS